MSRRIAALIAWVVLLLVGLPAVSQSSSAEAWTARLAEAWARPWVAEVNLEGGSMPGAQTWTGQLVRDGKGRYRFETSSLGPGRTSGQPAMTMVEICDGVILWRVMKMPRMDLPPIVLKRRLDKDRRELERNPTSGQFSWLESVTLSALEQGSFEVVEQRDGQVTLHSEIPDLPDTADFESAGLTLVLDSKTALPRSLEVELGFGHKITIDYKNARFATARDWDSSTFDYQPPPGARVHNVNR